MEEEAGSELEAEHLFETAELQSAPSCRERLTLRASSACTSRATGLLGLAKGGLQSSEREDCLRCLASVGCCVFGSSFKFRFAAAGRKVVCTEGACQLVEKRLFQSTRYPVAPRREL